MAAISFVVLALLIGVSITLQSGVNTQLRLVLGSPFQAGFVSFAIGTVALGVYAFSLPSRWTFSGVGNAPWWVWTGGLLGAYIVTMVIVLAPRLGATVLVALIVAGQMITALILDHFGLLGFQLHPARWERFLGVVLLLLGVVLIRRY